MEKWKKKKQMKSKKGLPEEWRKKRAKIHWYEHRDDASLYVPS